jgi:hypothetical protein
MMNARRRVCVEGDPNQIDSFAACLVAVMHAWERPVTYDWVAGLAGSAFSPVLDPGEDCTAWWMESGSESRLCFLARALGFTVDRVTRDAPWDDAARAVYAETGLLPPPHEAHFARLRAAFDRGDALVLRTWPAWSVLTGWVRDLDNLQFATLPGFEDLVGRIWGPAQAQLIYVLNPISPALSLEHTVMKALRFGGKIAGGQGADSAFRYGTALYTAAADKMDNEVFCSACGVNGDSCAHRTLMRMLGTQRSAVGFLEDARALVEDERLPWDASISSFEAMAEVTVAYCNWDEFHTEWPDQAFRRGLRQDFRNLAALQTQAAVAVTGLATAYEARVTALGGGRGASAN